PLDLSLFLFSCHVAPRPLHSFPTRRSSDLLVSADHEIPFANFTDIDPLYQDAKIAYTYTADPVAVPGGIKVNVSNLALRIDDNSDRKSTRLNSSHVKISYAVFCLKKKK